MDWLKYTILFVCIVACKQKTQSTTQSTVFQQSPLSCNGPESIPGAEKSSKPRSAVIQGTYVYYTPHLPTQGLREPRYIYLHDDSSAHFSSLRTYNPSLLNEQSQATLNPLPELTNSVLGFDIAVIRHRYRIDQSTRERFEIARNVDMLNPETWCYNTKRQLIILNTPAINNGDGAKLENYCLSNSPGELVECTLYISNQVDIAGTN